MSYTGRRLIIGFAATAVVAGVAQVAMAPFAVAAPQAPPAAALEVVSEAGKLWVFGTPGRDEISLRGDTHSITADSFQAPVKPGTNCTQGPDPTIVVCAGPFSSIEFIGGNGNDKANAKEAVGIKAKLKGGEGDDVLIGSPGDDLLSGEGGSDSLRGDAGNDELYGGAGPSPLPAPLGGPDKDFISGGSGTDTANYENHSERGTVSRDDIANDGVPGENDNVKKDVEKVIGEKITVLS